MNSQFCLAAHPTPETGQFDFSFRSVKDKEAYVEYERQMTSRLRLALNLAVRDREGAKQELARGRHLAYKKWQAQKNPTKPPSVA